MAQNFTGQNLKGRSFKAQDLTGADFSGADIRGANFAGATLVGAHFHGAIAGPGRRSLFTILLFAGFSGFILGLFGNAVSDTVNTIYFKYFGIRDGVVAFSTVGLFSALLLYWDLIVAIWGTILGGLLTWVGLFLWEYWQSHDFLNALLDQESATGGVTLTAIAFWIGISTIISLSALLLASARFQSNQHRRFGYVEGLAVLFAFWTAFPGMVDHAGWLAKVNAPLDTLLFLGLCIHTRDRILSEHPRYGWLRSGALRLASVWGTCFRKADLSAADFTGARLNGVDFTAARLVHTHFAQAQALNYARVAQTYLQQRSVRSLLASGNGVKGTYVGCDMRGAYLVGALLQGADFTRADLSDADLTGADLRGVVFVRSQLAGACLRSAQLTGCCVESWHIDTTTQLKDVDCDYIYLLSGQRERRPSHGNFQPGDFTKLFQDVLHTVDLIFRQGLDMSAFMTAFQQVQADRALSGETLSVRSIENKGDGMVVVKVEVPEAADKTQIHAALNQEYDQAIQRLETRYQAEIAAKDAQIDLYKQHQSELSQLTKLLTQPSPLSLSESPSTAKRVVLRLAQSETKGIPVTLQIGEENKTPSVELDGWLPLPQSVLSLHQQWQLAYRAAASQLSSNARISRPPAQITNVSYTATFDLCLQLEADLSTGLNDWLNADTFRSVREALMVSLSPTDSIQFFLQTDNLQIRALPFHLWQWFERYPKAELALSATSYQHPTPVSSASEIGKVRVLAIMGEGHGLDIERDRTLLAQLPDVELTCLVEPQRSQLNDALWSGPWDILFFAGHSTCQNQQQQLRINPTESLTLKEIKYALKKAISGGLQLAIFNACDGLQLLQDLNELHLPPVIVMRYPIPDAVAQTFLKHFLTAFSKGLPLHQALRDAREQLQGLESQYPFATWLPVLHQNSVVRSLTWQTIRGQ